MNRIALANMNVEQLVETFLAIALEQDRALRNDDTRKHNKLYDRMEDIEQELKSRDGDQRGLLSNFMQHSNAHVRLKAALAVLPVVPEAARRTLQDIVDRKEFPEAAWASGMLKALDEGSYVPS